MTVQTRIEADGLKTSLLLSSRGRRGRHAQRRDIVAAAGDDGGKVEATKLIHRSVDKLKVASRRARQTTPAQLERVIRSIKRYGIVAPVLVDGSGTVINGHVVVEAAKALNLPIVPVVEITHLSDTNVRGLRLALNRLAETGAWDMPKLSIELNELSTLNFTMVDTGFSNLELDIITLGDGSDAATRDQGDKLPKPVDHVVSAPGDIWQLGDHRIICGDATAPETYEALLGSERVQGVFSDPPYNVPIAGFVSGLGSTKHTDFVQGCGEMSDEEFTDFLRRYLKCSCDVSTGGAVIFACMDWRSDHLLRAAGISAGLVHMNTCVWAKGSGGMGGLYRSAYEKILVFCTSAKVQTNNIALGRHGRDRCNTWNYPGANRRGSSAAKALKLHATPKPVALVEDAICDVTNRGDLVLDPFLGSGTTLIAAHTTGRVGRFIELDPKFVDVAIRRFTELTGIEATQSATGQTFNEIERLRTERQASE